MEQTLPRCREALAADAGGGKLWRQSTEVVSYLGRVTTIEGQEGISLDGGENHQVPAGRWTCRSRHAFVKGLKNVDPPALLSGASTKTHVVCRAKDG